MAKLAEDQVKALSELKGIEGLLTGREDEIRQKLKDAERAVDLVPTMQSVQYRDAVEAVEVVKGERQAIDRLQDAVRSAIWMFDPSVSILDKITRCGIGGDFLPKRVQGPLSLYRGYKHWMFMDSTSLNGKSLGYCECYESLRGVDERIRALVPILNRGPLPLTV